MFYSLDFEKMSHCCKNSSQLKNVSLLKNESQKMWFIWKNGSHLKMCHSWNKWSQIKHVLQFGKNCYTLSHVSQLEKCVTVGEMSHT